MKHENERVLKYMYVHELLTPGHKGQLYNDLPLRTGNVPHVSFRCVESFRDNDGGLYWGS